MAPAASLTRALGICIALACFPGLVGCSLSGPVVTGVDEDPEDGPAGPTWPGQVPGETTGGESEDDGEATTGRSGPPPPDDGVDYGFDCIKIDRSNEPRIVPPAGLQVRFRVRSCNGDPVPPLQPEDVRVINLETDTPFDKDGGASISSVTHPDDYATYTILALDASDSVYERELMDEVVNGAIAYVDTVAASEADVDHAIGVMTFGRTEVATLLLDFTADYGDVRETLESLRSAEGRGSTDLYGAYTRALSFSPEGRLFQATNEHMIVMFTDGVHEAGDSAAQRDLALEAKATSEANVFVIGLDGGYDPALHAELATHSKNHIRVEDPTELTAAFESVAARANAYAKANYAIGLCTPISLGVGKLRLEVDYVSSNAGTGRDEVTLEYSTENLTGSVGECSAQDIAERPMRCFPQTQTCVLLGEGEDPRDLPEPDPDQPWQDQAFENVINVGPGFGLFTPSDVPWEELGPSTLVKIHWREQPYHDKWVINTAGEEGSPVVVMGVTSEGRKPVIDAGEANTRTALTFWNEERGIIKIGGAFAPAGKPAYVFIDQLEIRGAKRSTTFFDDEGEVRAYAEGAAAIYVEAGSNVHIRNCEIHDSEQGVLALSQAKDVYLTGNTFYDNGVEDSTEHHSIAIEVDGAIIEHNEFRSLCAGCLGLHIEDRSAATVVRYNFVNGGWRQLDLIESPSPSIRDATGYGDAYVYGNIFLDATTGSAQLVRFGGESGDKSLHRAGTLHFFHNSIYSTSTDPVAWFFLSNTAANVDARNNIVWIDAPEPELGLLGSGGRISFSGNWLNEGWVGSLDPRSEEVTDAGDNLTGTDPGWTDPEMLDFRLSGTSPALNAAVDLASATDPDHVPVREWEKGSPLGRLRIDDGEPDIGALER